MKRKSMIILAFFAIMVVLGISLFIYNFSDITIFFENAKKERIRKGIVETVKNPKVYLAIDLANRKLSGRIKTRWEGGFMFYQFNLSGSKDAGSVDITKEVEKMSELIISFLDKDGFKLYEFRIPISEMSQDVTKAGNVEKYSINSKVAVDVDLYKDFDKYIVSSLDN